MHAKMLQSRPTLCDPMDSSPPGSSVPGILQARILAGVAISFSIGELKYHQLEKRREDVASSEKSKIFLGKVKAL